MQRVIFGAALIMLAYIAPAQGLYSRLAEAVKYLENDPQLKHAIVSLCVADGKTGKPLFEKNAQVGLAAASTQKVITSAAALNILGADYQYTTELGYDGIVENGVLKGNLHLKGNGDPTLGSWRYTGSRESGVLQRWIRAIKGAGIRSISGTVVIDQQQWSTATIPDGWIWQDIGNYYGAGAAALNWRENQYDLILRSGRNIGDTCTIVALHPELLQAALVCEVTTAAKGTGDNAYIYLPPYARSGYVRGTIPLGATAFSISGSFPNTAIQLQGILADTLNRAGISLNPAAMQVGPTTTFTPLYAQLSPSLDSINHWFLKKSINLYGEALVKTIAFEKGGFGATDKGIGIIQSFWTQRGIDKSAINIMDGSGLSPQNRITTDALVKVMQYARSRPWYKVFYNALPEINGIRMKSGSINGVRSFTGYTKSKEGNDYTFAIIINNYDGSAGEVVRKMYRVLDVLK